MKREHKLFFTKIIIGFAVFICADQIIGTVLYHFFIRQNSGEYSVANHVAYTFNEDVLVLGSSRATHHYDPEIIKKTLNLSCYNGGRDGQGILYSSAIFQLALAHHTPKYLILDINSSDLSVDAAPKDRLSTLLPYLKISDSIKNIMDETSPFEKYKCLLQTYRYNGEIFTIIQHNFLPGISSANTNGFRPLNTIMSLNKLPKKAFIKPYSDVLDPSYTKAFYKIINRCKAKQIKLYVFISPRYNDDTQTNSYLKIEEMCSKYSIPLHDFTNNLFFKNPGYYADRGHLNATGATFYTDSIVSFIAKHPLVN